MSFEKLLEELDTMAKAFGDEAAKDDEKIKAAAADGNVDADDDGEDDVTGEKKGAADGDKDDEPMGKSFAFTLENGEVIEAMDGTEMVKSLMARVESTEGVMAKALSQAVELIGKQGEMIKSLRADVAKIASSGSGRKAVLSVAEKTTAGAAPEQLAKSATGLTKQEFFAKANAAFDTGRITGKELTVIDVSLRSGSEIDQGLVAKVVG
jgi:hypothetical protein